MFLFFLIVLLLYCCFVLLLFQTRVSQWMLRSLYAGKDNKNCKNKLVNRKSQILEASFGRGKRIQQYTSSKTNYNKKYA